METSQRGREMRTMGKNIKSERRTVESGVHQGSVLAPIFFLEYINNMPERVIGSMSLLADDAKLLRHLRNSKDWEILQDLNKNSKKDDVI